MSPTPADRDRWQRIEEILDTAFELEGEDRSAFLDSACSGVPELRAEVDELLAADEDYDGLLSTPLEKYAALVDLPEKASEIPDHLGPYRVIRRIGAGGMGEVFEAEDERLGRHVALKLLPRAWIADREVEERFLREARAASLLDHPNICAIHDIGETESGHPYIVMAFYSGQTLKRRLAKGPLDFDEARDFACQIARGLQHAHEKGIVHRDIKPANIIVNERGEVKVLDFGIAKVAGDAGLTRTGNSPGTPYYMSPEQAAATTVDARTDIWSMGVVLYEMIVGRRPFAGSTAYAAIYSIVNEEPEPLTVRRQGVPEDLQRVVRRALAKDPAERYQSFAEVLADLDPVTTPTVATATATATRRRLGWPIAAVIGLVVLALGQWAFSDRQPVPVELPAPEQTAELATAGSVSLAVLYFDNLTGDPELEWLRSGLTDMLVADLSQSPGVEVLSTGRLYQILSDLDALEQTPLSFNSIQELATLGAVKVVVRGGYARLGGVLRITFTLEEAATGSILESDRIEGWGDESVFAVVDELSTAVRNKLQVRRPAEVSQHVQAITTPYLEAWRYYSEGVALRRQSKNLEAIALLEKAVEIDPNFALALVDLGRLHAGLGQAREAAEYKQRAAEHADRLPAHQRFSIEGAQYLAEWKTYGRAIQTFQEAARLYPERNLFRSNLALLYMYHERYEEAVELYDELIARGTDFAPTYLSAANAYAALGQIGRGTQLLEEYRRRHPASWYAHGGLGWHLSHSERLDEAAIHNQRAAELRPGEFYVHYVDWRIAVLRRDFARAEQAAAAMAQMQDAYSRWRGAVSQARNLLYRGSSREALAKLEEAREAYPRAGPYSALARCWKAELLLQRGEPEQALAEAKMAREEGRGEWAELQGLYLEALANDQLGRREAADRAELELRRHWEAGPNKVEERQLELLGGRLALARGDTEAAVASLERAAALLPPRGLEIHWHALPQHVPIWSALGEAELAAGRLEAARSWFAKVAASGAEHLDFPVPYVRSFYYLGLIDYQLGEDEGWPEQFVEWWRGGDLDRDRLGEAVAWVDEKSS